MKLVHRLMFETCKQTGRTRYAFFLRACATEESPARMYAGREIQRGDRTVGARRRPTLKTVSFSTVIVGDKPSDGATSTSRSGGYAAVPLTAASSCALMLTCTPLGDW